MFNGSWGIYGFKSDTNEHPQWYRVNEGNWSCMTDFQVIKTLCKTNNNITKTHKIHDKNIRYKNRMLQIFYYKNKILQKASFSHSKSTLLRVRNLLIYRERSLYISCHLGLIQSIVLETCSYLINKTLRLHRDFCYNRIRIQMEFVWTEPI